MFFRILRELRIDNTKFVKPFTKESSLKNTFFPSNDTISGKVSDNNVCRTSCKGG